MSMTRMRTQANNKNEMNNLTSSVQGLASNALVQGQSLLDRVFPPEQRSALWARLQTFAAAHPLIAAFLLCQIALSSIPLLLFIMFTITVLVFSLLVGLIMGLVGALLFTGFMVICALFFVLPTLFVTTTAATSTFLWGTGGFYLLRWLNSGAPAAQGKTVGEKLNNLSGGRLNSLMDTARETAGDAAPVKQTNGSRTAQVKPRKLKQEDKDSADEKSSNGFTVLSEPAESPYDDLNITSTTNIAPGGGSAQLKEPVGRSKGSVPGLSGL